MKRIAVLLHGSDGRSRRMRCMGLLWPLVAFPLCGPALALAAAGDAGDTFAACDGTADAGPALQAAYDGSAAEGGGIIVIPSGRTCRLATPVSVRSRVTLHCAPGARLVAAAEANASLFGSNLVDVTIDDCDVEVARGAQGAVDLAGAGLEIVRSRFRGEDEPTARAWLNLDCAGDGACRIADSEVHCAEKVASPVPARPSPALQVTIAPGGRGVVRDNDFRGCSRAIEAKGNVAVVRNAIASAREDSVGISVESRQSGGEISDNEIRSMGRAATGISLVGVNFTADGNRVHVEGKRATAFAIHAADARLVGNLHSVLGAEGAGYRLRESNGITIASCTGVARKSETHVTFEKTQQVIVNGCVLKRGAYGVAEADPGSSLNVTVSANRMIRMSSACVVVATGFTVADNYCAWLHTEASALVLGDHRPPGIGNVHSVVSGNILHCPDCKALVVPTSIGGRCRQDPKRACREPGDCRSPRSPAGGPCDAGKITSLVVNDNSFLGANDGIGIDFGNLSREGSPALTDLVIEGNQFSLHGRCTAIRFPSDPAVRSRIRGVEIGVNSSRCPTYLAGFAPEMSQPSQQGLPQGVGLPPPKQGSPGTAPPSPSSLP